MNTIAADKEHGDTRNDFKQKIKTWFQSKGIVNKLELYLKSQMIAEFQGNVGQAFNPAKNIAISPKIQAVKLLIADFLVQEDLLFSLSVFCSEVPFLLNLTYYSNYVSHLANPGANISGASSKSKPKFSEADFRAILEALGFNVYANDENILYELYKTGTFGSLLSCLLCTLPTVMKKYRSVENVLTKTRKNEKYFRKLLKIERAKVKRMYTVLQNAYGVVEKHRNEMKDVIALQSTLKQDSIAIEEKSVELSKKETELMTWHKALELKESSLEKNYRNKMNEVEERYKVLESQAYELQSKYEMLQNDRVQLEVDKKRVQELAEKAPVVEPQEVIRLQEYEQKFRLLREEVEILKKCNDEHNGKKASKDNLASKDVQCTCDTLHQSQQTEIDVFINMEEYVNLMEKENSILKLSSNKQRYYINQLTSEIIFLKNKLDYLEKEIKMRSELQRDIEFRSVAHKLYFPKKYWHSEESNRHKMVKKSIGDLRSSRRKLFSETEAIQGSESSSGTSKEINVTDEIVADAINEVEKLEYGSETLDRNFKSLERLISRNIAFNEDRTFGCSSISDSSPSERMKRFAQQTRCSDDADCSNVSLNVEESTPVKHSAKGAESKTTTFQKMFSKYKKDRMHAENRTIESENCEEKASSLLVGPDSSSLPERFTEKEVVTNTELIDQGILVKCSGEITNQLIGTDAQKNDDDSRVSQKSIEPRVHREHVEAHEGTEFGALANPSEDGVVGSSDGNMVSGSLPVVDSNEKPDVSESNNLTADSESVSTDIVISAGSVDTKSSSDFWN